MHIHSPLNGVGGRGGGKGWREDRMTFGEWMGVIVLKNGGPKISIQQWRRSDVMSPHTNETLLIKHNLKHKGGDEEG